MKLVILEGPDGAGKTTLARQSQHLEYIHFGPPPKGKLGAWAQYFDLLVDLWDHPRPGGVIIDRFIHGELIYGPILRNDYSMTWAHIRMLERVLMGLNASLTVCLPPWEAVRENWERNIKSELILTEVYLFDVYRFYQKLVHRTSMIPRRLYDYTKPHDQELDPHVSWDYHLVNEGPGIGIFAPGNVLIVGDEVNKRSGKEGWPFVAAGGSSLWLAELLEQANIQEHGLYWINAKTNGVDTDSKFLSKLAPSKVIALGLNAVRWCNRHLELWEFYTLQHPQYHKRFRHSEPYPLIDLLR